MAAYSPLSFVLASAERYFPPGMDAVLEQLPIPKTTAAFTMTLMRVQLPDWAADLGVGDFPSLLVPCYCVEVSKAGENIAEWERCDWWQACFSFLTGEAERAFETENGPVHSYAFRLPLEIAPLWDYAWVNRILLFLRRWAARLSEQREEELFGPLPEPEILLTHDVDALEKTLPTRIKALAFDLFNVLRLLLQGQLGSALRRMVKGLGFFLRPANYNFLGHITALEKSYGRISTFNVYGGKTGRPRGLKSYLMDPGYDIARPEFGGHFKCLADEGFLIGVHPSFDVFANPLRLRAEVDRISAIVGRPVTEIRQHWLRFSWAETWHAQELAGLKRDTTLGFNDRPGFRNGAALSMPAWIGSQGRASEQLRSLPLLLMDSHLFDYHVSDEANRRAIIDHWFAEIKAVHGIATVVWHQRVFHSKDYGWGDDYDYLLSRLP